MIQISISVYLTTRPPRPKLKSAVAVKASTSPPAVLAGWVLGLSFSSSRSARDLGIVI